MFQTWCCLSLLGAIVQDNVWYEKFPQSKLFPNLYIFLLGPSGIGKGEAIDQAIYFVRDTDREPYQGKTTAANLIDIFGEGATRDKKTGALQLSNPHLYLVTPELSLSMGTGALANEMIKLLTELYTAKDYPFQEGTRTSGRVIFQAPNVNWLGGSTDEWMMESVPRAAIESGFFARTIPIAADYDLEKRISVPTVPPDYHEVRDYLQKKVNYLATIEGRFRMSNKAKALKDQWYHTRPAPTERLMIPSWKRQDDHAYKLGMVLAIADLTIGQEELVIKSKHIYHAIRLITDAHRNLPRLINLANVTRATAPFHTVAELLEGMGQATLERLSRKTSRRGIHAKELKSILRTLVEQRDVEVERRLKGEGRGGVTVYRWVRGRKIEEELRKEEK